MPDDTSDRCSTQRKAMERADRAADRSWRAYERAMKAHADALLDAALERGNLGDCIDPHDGTLNPLCVLDHELDAQQAERRAGQALDEAEDALEEWEDTLDELEEAADAYCQCLAGG